MTAKAKAEQIFVDEMVRIGIKKLWEMDGEERCRNNTYYQLELIDLTVRHWTNLSEGNLNKIRNSLSQHKEG